MVASACVVPVPAMHVVYSHMQPLDWIASTRHLQVFSAVRRCEFQKVEELLGCSWYKQPTYTQQGGRTCWFRVDLFLAASMRRFQVGICLIPCAAGDMLRIPD